MAISMLKIRRPLGRLIFNMGIAIPGKTVFLIETAPCLFYFVNTMAADDLAMQGVRTLAAMALTYRKTSNIRGTIVGNKIVDDSDVVGALPVGAAPTTSSFATWYLASIDWAKANARRDKKYLKFRIWCVL